MIEFLKDLERYFKTRNTLITIDYRRKLAEVKTDFHNMTAVDCELLNLFMDNDFNSLCRKHDASIKLTHDYAVVFTANGKQCTIATSVLDADVLSFMAEMLEEGLPYEAE